MADCFAGQPKNSGIRYLLEPEIDNKDTAPIADAPVQMTIGSLDIIKSGFKNQELKLSDQEIMINIQSVQYKQNISQSTKLVTSNICKVNLGLEMLWQIF